MERKSESIFTDQDMTVQNYRAFSPLSLLAFLVSLVVAVVALVNEDLVFLAGLGVLIAGISIFRLARAEGRTSGYILSGLALFISLFAISAPITYRRVRLDDLVNESIRHSERWLELVRGDRMHEAYELTRMRYQRESDGTDLAVAHGPRTAPGDELDSYLQNEPESSLSQDGDQGDLKQVGIVYYGREPKIKVENFTTLYEYRRPTEELMRFRITMRRQVYDKGRTAYWNVKIRNVDPEIPRVVYTPPSPLAPSDIAH